MSGSSRIAGRPVADQDAAIREAAAGFADVWAELLTTLSDSYGCEMNCTEANAAAGLYRALGDESTAQLVLDAHARHDDEGDQHYQGTATAAGKERR